MVCFNVCLCLLGSSVYTVVNPLFRSRVIILTVPLCLVIKWSPLITSLHFVFVVNPIQVQCPHTLHNPLFVHYTLTIVLIRKCLRVFPTNECRDMLRYALQWMTGILIELWIQEHIKTGGLRSHVFTSATILMRSWWIWWGKWREQQKAIAENRTQLCRRAHGFNS